MARRELKLPHVWDLLPRPLSDWRAALAGLGGTGAATLLCSAIADWLPAHGVAMFYILAVVAIAVAFGNLAGITTAIASFLAYNFFFVHPTYTFSISDPRDLFALLVFFAVAVSAGSLAGRLREVAEQARQRSKSLETSNALALQLSSALRADDIATMLTSQASKAADAPACLLRPTGDHLTIWTQQSDTPALTTADWQAAQRAAATRQTVYPSIEGWSGAHYEFRPLIVRSAVTAVLGVHLLRSDDVKDATLDAMVHQAAVALERLSLEAEKAAVEKEVETERLRSALLSSVSHDIKTPLAAIQGAATSLRALGDKMPEASKAELLATIEEEAVRLSRFVTNMLDMMRFQSGPPAVAKDWIDLADTLGTTVVHARKVLPSVKIVLDVAASPAIVRGDETLLDHVFVNIIENAANASPNGGEVKVALRGVPQGYQVTVEDDGKGIAPNDLPRVFDKFYRTSASKTRGSGLGLTICKEVMTAIGGRISVESPITAAQGTRVTLDFPSTELAHTVETLQ